MARDSPSRQLLWELSRLAVSQQEDLYERLDRESQEREAVHKHALAEANARREATRMNAEMDVEREYHEIQIQEERARREAEARQEEERQYQLRAEQGRLEKRQAAERVEAAARAERAATEERNFETARQKAEKDRRDTEAAKAKKVAQEAAARKKAEDEKRARDAAAAAVARSTADVQPIPSTMKQSGASIPQQTDHARREAEHRRYLEIHKNLKELRNFMDQQAKQDPKLKSQMGDMRRTVRKSVGQVIEGKGVNVKPVSASGQSVRLYS